MKLRTEMTEPISKPSKRVTLKRKEKCGSLISLTRNNLFLCDRRVYYGEYKCSGPGANMTGRVSWARMLTDKEAQPFLGTSYIEGDTWLLSP